MKEQTAPGLFTNLNKSHSLRAISCDITSQGGSLLLQISGIVQLQMCKSDKKFSCSKNASYKNPEILFL